MNKRTLKLAQKIIKKAIQVNSRTKASTFVYFMGHTNGLSIDIYRSGWKEGAKADYKATVYLDWADPEIGLQSMLDVLKEVK